MKEERIRLTITILLVFFLFQFLPKVYHSISLMKRMQKVTGYIFGTIWWCFGLNLITYFIASHVSFQQIHIIRRSSMSIEYRNLPMLLVYLLDRLLVDVGMLLQYNGWGHA